MVGIGEKLDDRKANDKWEGGRGWEGAEDSGVSSVGVTGIHPGGNV